MSGGADFGKLTSHSSLKQHFVSHWLIPQ